uniref:Uncharacterized protein n=1 Tax=Arundo donax TaxID=35708 RepID=A0A0A9BN30_ARUDO
MKMSHGIYSRKMDQRHICVDFISRKHGMVGLTYIFVAYIS